MELVLLCQRISISPFQSKTNKKYTQKRNRDNQSAGRYCVSLHRGQYSISVRTFANSLC